MGVATESFVDGGILLCMKSLFLELRSLPVASLSCFGIKLEHKHAISQTNHRMHAFIDFLVLG